VRRGYNEPEVDDDEVEAEDGRAEGVSLAGGPRWMPDASFGSMGSGRLATAEPGAAFR